MRLAFTETAAVTVVSLTGAISFPSPLRGRRHIAEVLSRRFGQSFENVYTFCLTDPPSPKADRFSCDWLVGMTEKETGAVRIGSGRYDWSFEDRDPRRVETLTITIEQMETSSPDASSAVMRWLAALPYPWCSAPILTRDAPALDGVAAIVGRYRTEPA